MPTDASGYTTELDAMNAIVKLATGEKVLMGLSGGAGAALYAGATGTNADGTALFSKQLLVAPYAALRRPPSAFTSHMPSHSLTHCM